LAGRSNSARETEKRRRYDCGDSSVVGHSPESKYMSARRRRIYNVRSRYYGTAVEDISDWKKA
jgi:hypothetical protein